ncbi:MAG: endonuclease/exonuclease/phosphatase family protein [Steroidobacteraceae bacterium]|nr:endonuclease/exonuclease/phosphatase family protein [Steroidobacteraceae bacterium]
MNPESALVCMLGGLAVATAFALLAPLGWPFELFSHFRVQYLAAALALAALLTWRRRAVPAVLALVIAVWHALPALSPSHAVAQAPDCAGPAFTVATVNVRYSNTRPEAFRAWLAKQPADFLLIQEVTPAWAVELEAQSAYPYRYVLTRDDPYGLAVLSRWPVESVTRIDLAGDGLPSVAGVVDVGGQRIRFLGLHTHWPITPDLAAARDEALQGAAQLVLAADLPVVMLGDLNLTPDAPMFERLVGQAGLRDVMQGRGWQPTWRAGFWPLALRIDHILVSPGLCVEAAAVGPPIGSDHRPVVARLRS